MKSLYAYLLLNSKDFTVEFYQGSIKEVKTEE